MVLYHTRQNNIFTFNILVPIVFYDDQESYGMAWRDAAIDYPRDGIWSDRASASNWKSLYNGYRET
jgi:hypothetical protein